MSYPLEQARKRAWEKAEEAEKASQVVSLLTFFIEHPTFQNFPPRVELFEQGIVVTLTNRQAKSLRKLLGINVDLEDG